MIERNMTVVLSILAIIALIMIYFTFKMLNNEEKED